MNKKRMNKLEHWQIMAIALMICDFLSIHFSYFIALLLRFDFMYSHIEAQYLPPYYGFITAYAIGAIILFAFFGMYRFMWRYISYGEMIRIISGSLTASLLHCILITIIFCRMPLSYYLWGSLAQVCCVVAPRYFYRFVLMLRAIRKPEDASTGRVMVIGAGESGRMIVHDIRSSEKLNDKAVCIIDDNSNKWGRSIEGVPIVGGREDILTAVEKYKITKIFLAIPSISAEDKKEILSICNETGCEIKQLPGLYQFATGQVTVSDMKDVAIEDLLGREPIKVDLQEVFEFLHGKVVLVTGGGGSIGSEICRQVAAHGPRQLIIFDVYENNAYDIQLELREKYPDLNLVTLIGSVRDSRRLDHVFSTYRPDVVYHAAAHKHVPLMEDSPCEAIKNNAIGTYKTAYAAMRYRCQRFVLISTDKAVNPTNIMGASKRLCEMVIQSFARKIATGKADTIPQLYAHRADAVAQEASVLGEQPDVSLYPVETQFVAVRFGNVLGSNGSVVPLFKKQIAKGGPVTVTHPDIIRYFMTVPEAVSLVLQAGTYAKGGEIFVLDMGSPVKIDTLARNLIKLSGFKPDVDIKIQYTGLRPGEKLYEEKLMAEEGLEKTANERIHIGKPIPFDVDEFFVALNNLMDVANNNREDLIRQTVASMVNTYHPSNPEVTIVKDGKYQALFDPVRETREKDYGS